MKVLLGIGGSDDSFRALDLIVERAASAGDHLTVAVLENPESDRAPDNVEARAREALRDAGLELVEERNGPGTATVRRVGGEPGPRLVDVAESEGYDEIVLGGGQRSPLGKIRVGHIAEFVILNARTTVTLVR